MDDYVFYKGAQFQYKTCIGADIEIVITEMHISTDGTNVFTKLYFQNSREKRTYCLSAVEAASSLASVSAIQSS